VELERYLIPKYVDVIALVATALIIGSGCAQKTTQTPSTFTSATATTPISSIVGTSNVGTSTIASSTTAVSSSTTNFLVFQQYTSLAIVFQALVTFNVNNTNVTYPSNLFVPQVPITWSGASFSGTLHESGPGEDITDKVAGVISADARTMVSLIYSREIVRATNSVTSYSISIFSLPLAAVNTSGIYIYSGFAIQGYVSEISYLDGTIVSGKLVASTTYVSSDWGNIQQPPTLTITFGK
jgi:hypothetical protein